MRSPLSGPIATLLMLVPLVAVPVLAVVGVPQLKSGSSSDTEALALASPDQGGEKSTKEVFAPIANLGQDDRAGGFLESSPKPGAEAAAAPTEAPAQPPAAAGQPTPSPGPNSIWDPPGKALQGWRLEREALAESEQHAHGSESSPQEHEHAHSHAEAAAERSGQDAEPTPWADGATHPEHPAAGGEPLLDDSASAHPTVEHANEAEFTNAADSAAGRSEESASGGASGSLPAEPGTPPAASVALTWPDAIDRLNKLGIHQYQLQPGTRKNEVHFSCNLTPANNPRVTHRFEAEAAEPVVAVEKVLQQIQEKFQQP